MGHTYDLEQLLADLVAFRTVSGERNAASACLDYADDYLSERGMAVSRLEFGGFPSLVATTRQTKTPKLLLQAHIDVVAAPDNCYTMHEKNGKLLGRGVFDMKFAAAVFLKVVDALKGRINEYDFGIMLTSDEEVGGKHGVKALLDDGYGADICFIPDAGKDWKIETSHKGCWIGRVMATGATAHGSKPWDGDNAIDRLMDALAEIRELFDGQNPDTDTLSINQISGGAAMNQVAGQAEATFDLRFIDDQSCEQARKKMEAVCKRHDVLLETVWHEDVSHTDISHPLIEPFLEIVERIHGQPPEPVRSLGMSDARYFTKRGIPVILIRPSGGGSHADHEWIDKADLETYFQAVKEYVETAASRDQ